MTPVKKITVRKKRQEEIAEVMSPRAARKYERDAENALIDYEEEVDRRYDYAQGILKMQNQAVLGAVDVLVEQMKRMAGTPIFTYKGSAYPASPSRLLQCQERNFVWIAVRLLAACAVWDVQISGFKLPEDHCAKCEVKKPTKRRR